MVQFCTLTRQKKCPENSRAFGWNSTRGFSRPRKRVCVPACLRGSLTPSRLLRSAAVSRTWRCERCLSTCTTSFVRLGKGTEVCAVSLTEEEDTRSSENKSSFTFGIWTNKDTLFMPFLVHQLKQIQRRTNTRLWKHVFTYRILRQTKNLLKWIPPG